jgi:hypothetical protein
MHTWQRSIFTLYQNVSCANGKNKQSRSFRHRGITSILEKPHVKQKYNKPPIWTAHLHNFRKWKKLPLVCLMIITLCY